MLLEKIYTVYAKRDDITFIMKETYDKNEDCKTMTVVGWHYGEPDPETTPNYIGKLTAEFK